MIQHLPMFFICFTLAKRPLLLGASLLLPGRALWGGGPHRCPVSRSPNFRLSLSRAADERDNRGQALVSKLPRLDAFPSRPHLFPNDVPNAMHHPKALRCTFRHTGMLFSHAPPARKAHVIPIHRRVFGFDADWRPSMPRPSPPLWINTQTSNQTISHQHRIASASSITAISASSYSSLLGHTP